MRKVTRPECPESLKAHADKWTKELLQEISKVNNDYSKVPDKLKNKYRQNDVKEALRNMYTNHCCYCESRTGISSYGRIEHLKPKGLKEFHHLSFDWHNLHWCCEICNTSYKKTNWDFENPILDPSKDEIKDYLKLNLNTGKYEAIENNPRASTTILHTGLNRTELVKARKQLIIRLCKHYNIYKNAEKGDEYLEDLEKLKEDLDFPSLKEDLIQYIRQKKQAESDSTCLLFPLKRYINVHLNSAISPLILLPSG